MNPPIKFSKEKPACFDRLNEVFNITDTWEKGLVITYDGVIHYKFDSEVIPPQVLVHELVHVKQQAGIEPMEYVERFINDMAFRRKNEVEAFRAEAKWVRDNIKNDQLRRKLIDAIWRRISGPTYAGMITYQEAKEII